MEYTEEQKAEFKRLFGARRKRQIILAVPLVVLAVAFALLSDEKAGETMVGLPMAVIGPGFLVLVLGALLFSFRNWRCPACDTYLGKGISPRFCASCGVALR